LIALFDQDLLAQGGGAGDGGSQDGRAHRRHRLGAERQGDEALLPVEPGAGLAIDDVHVELVAGEAGVVGAGGDADLEAARLLQQTAEARDQPLRGEARRGMQAQKLRAAGGDAGEAEAQLAEAALHVTHQRFALRGQADRAALAEEERGRERGLQAANRMTDGRGGESEVVGGDAEGAGAGRGLEGAEGGKREVTTHGA
jgi:hypothetical protein